jgi:hypothetical protein
MSKFSKTIILAAILIIIPQIAHAGWMRTYGGPSGDAAYWVEITVDGSYVISGATIVNNDVFAFLLKTNLDGDSLWMRTYEGWGRYFYCIQQTVDKGFVIAGKGVALGPTFTPYVWLVKTDSAGDTLWTRWYGGDEADYGWFVRQTTDGGYIITGWTKSFGAGKKDIWVLRTDSGGDTLWTRTFGGESDDEGRCVIITSDGNYVVVGKDGTVPGESAVWLLKIDDEGNLMWERKYGGNSEGRCVQETADGGLIISGSSYAGIYLLKTDSAGDSLWSRTYARNPEYIGYCVEQTTDRGYIIAGVTSFATFPSRANGWLIKTDSLGDTLWTRKFVLTPDGDNTLSSVHQTADGGYIITGTTGKSSAEKGFEIWLIKTDSLGYVGVEEIDNPSVVENISTIDSSIEFSYTNLPGGFHAYVYDASGQKVGEIHNANASGTVEWGQGQQAGVYFIREISGNPSVRKVVLVK